MLCPDYRCRVRVNEHLPKPIDRINSQKKLKVAIRYIELCGHRTATLFASDQTALKGDAGIFQRRPERYWIRLIAIISRGAQYRQRNQQDTEKE